MYPAYDYPVQCRIPFPLCIHATFQLCYLSVPASRSLCYWLLRRHLRFVHVCFPLHSRFLPVPVPFMSLLVSSVVSLPLDSYSVFYSLTLAGTGGGGVMQPPRVFQKQLANRSADRRKTWYT